MQHLKRTCLLLSIFSYLLTDLSAQPATRSRVSFNKDWKFNLGEVAGASSVAYDDKSWRVLDLPHDWSVELKFDEHSPTGTGGGALPGGIGWYRKTFTLPVSEKGKNVYIDFDGVYRKSEVWINGHSLGMRPSGYISFRY